MAGAFTPFLTRAASGEPLDNSAMAQAMALLLEGAASGEEAAGFLMALRARGETVGEITAAARAMRDKALKVATERDIVDTCGTGGDGAGTYNISTAAALVAAGAGAAIAKHGNKAASSKSGSSDVLAALGVNLAASPQQISACIDQAGVGFMFAAAHHKAVAHVADVRKKLGVRTLFNLLGPLTNPAGAKRQLMGVFSKDLVRPLAEALMALGARSAWVVHGSDGLDEITTTGETFVAAVEGGGVREFIVAPEDAGLDRADPAALAGGDPAENARALAALLDGAPGAYRDITVFNAAAALVVAEKAETLKDGAECAAQAIDDGRARAALESLVRHSNTPLTDDPAA